MHESDWSRRAFMGATVAGLATACTRARAVDDAAGDEAAAAELEAELESGNIYMRLFDMKPHLPAHGHATKLGGSRMPAEVVEAMQEANHYFVLMDELAIHAGEKAAKILKAEAALITSGASGGLLLGTAACLTGDDEEKMRALPHPSWSKRECVIQKSHRYMYDHALRAAGAELVEVEGRDQLMNAIGENTALIFGLPPHGRPRDPDVEVECEELIEIGKDAGVPVLIDGASRLPPTGNLTVWGELGADLVVLSGGKGLEGPQSTGLLSGRADLIAAARTQAAPNEFIGRGMKVGKEEIVGLIVALERYQRLDHEAERVAWQRKAEYIAENLQGISGFEATAQIDGPLPYVQLGWDEATIPLSATEARETLKRRESRRVAISSLFGGNRVQTRCMRDGEEVLVARYLREFFTDAAKG